MPRVTGVTGVDRGGGEGGKGEEEEEKSLRTNRQETGPPKVVQEVLADIKRIGIQKIPFEVMKTLLTCFTLSYWYIFFKFEHLVLVLVFSVKQHLLEPLAPLDLIGKVRRPRLKKPQYQNDHDHHCHCQGHHRHHYLNELDQVYCA